MMMIKNAKTPTSNLLNFLPMVDQFKLLISALVLPIYIPSIYTLPIYLPLNAHEFMFTFQHLIDAQQQQQQQQHILLAPCNN